MTLRVDGPRAAKRWRLRATLLDGPAPQPLREGKHIVAGWHCHDPAGALSIYSDVKADELGAVGASLSG